MAIITCIVGSPSSPSRTAFVARFVADYLARAGNVVETISVRDLPSEDLLRARIDSPAIAAAMATVAQAEGLVVATPIYKASFAGMLKTFIDLLPQFAFRDKAVLPLATGGASSHILALDYGLRPVLMSLDAAHVAPSYVVLEQGVRAPSAGGAGYELTDETAAKLTEVAERFARFIARV
jgi:FMN reductase